MAWSPIPHPYEKYIYENPNDYTSVDPDLIKKALAGSGLDDSSISSIFSSWASAMNPSSSTAGSTTTPGTAPIDYRSLIENDPVYKQARADAASAGISDAASRAAAMKKTLIDWGVIPDFAGAGAGMGLSKDTLGYLSTDIDPQTGQLAAANEAQGLSLHSRLGKANEDNLRAIRNSLAARGMYQSGELGYGLQENAQQYKQASTDAEKEVLGRIEQTSGQFAQGERQRQRDLADARSAAADRAVATAGTTPTGATTSTPSGATATSAGATGSSNFLLPAHTASVWDVNTASTMDAINAAKTSGGSITIRPDDPEAMTKANAAAQAGVPVSIQVNGSGDDTPETLAARVKQFQTQFPGASFTLDLESPNFRGGPGTQGYQNMQQYAQQVQAVAGNTPLVITTEGVSDFNYGAWADNPNVIFAPQAYWGDMTPRDVQSIANILIAQGVDPSKIVPVIAPGQDVGSWKGPVSVYGAPTAGQQQTPSQPAAPADTGQYYMAGPVGDASRNAVDSASNYSPETIQAILAAVKQAYFNPDMDTTLSSGGMY